MQEPLEARHRCRHYHVATDQTRCMLPLFLPSWMCCHAWPGGMVGRGYDNVTYYSLVIESGKDAWSLRVYMGSPQCSPNVVFGERRALSHQTVLSETPLCPSVKGPVLQGLLLWFGLIRGGNPP